VAAGTRHCVVVNSAGTDDGRRTPYGVLAEDVNATSAAKRSVAYLTGNFNERLLVFGGTDTIETHRDNLRELGIFTQVTQQA
jgi:hypothetical protein